MGNTHGENLIPFYSMGKPVKVRTIEELKNLILSSEDVRDVIAETVGKRTAQYQYHF
jgi:hypothetical protein